MIQWTVSLRSSNYRGNHLKILKNAVKIGYLVVDVSISTAFGRVI